MEGPDTVDVFAFGLLHQLHARGHGRRDGCFHDAANLQPGPFVPIVQGMHQLQFPLAVQRFVHQAGGGC